LKDANIFGFSIYGDGASIKTVPQINILAASPNNPGCVLDVIDCTNQMSEGGEKDAGYTVNSMLLLMNTIDPNKILFNVIAFDGASNVQKAGTIMAQHFPRVTVIHGAEHVVSIIFEKIVKITPFKQYSHFCKMVSTLLSPDLPFLHCV
jgi:hypothetical protein